MNAETQTASLTRAADGEGTRLARRVRHHLPHELRIAEHAFAPMPEYDQFPTGYLSLSPSGNHAFVATVFNEAGDEAEAPLRVDVWALPELRRVARLEEARAGGVFRSTLDAQRCSHLRFAGWLDDDRIAFASRGLLVTHDLRSGARKELRLGDSIEHFSVSSSTLAVSLFPPRDGSYQRRPNTVGVQLMPLANVITGRFGRNLRTLGHELLGGLPFFIALDQPRNTLIALGALYDDGKYLERVMRVDLTTDRVHDLLTRSGPNLGYSVCVDLGSGRTAVADENAITWFGPEGDVVAAFARKVSERSNLCLATGGELVIDCCRGVARAWSIDGRHQGETAFPELGWIMRVCPVPGRNEMLALVLGNGRYELVRIDAGTLQPVASSISSPILPLAKNAIEASEDALWLGDRAGRVHVHANDAEPVQTLSTARGPIYEIRHIPAEGRTGISSSSHALLWLNDGSRELAVQRAADGTAVENGSLPARIQTTPRGHFRVVNNRGNQRTWVSEDEFYTLYPAWRQLRVWKDDDKNDWLGLPDHQCVAYVQLSENALSITSFGGDVVLLLADGDLVALTPGRFSLPAVSEEPVPWSLTGDGARRCQSGVIAPLGANGCDKLGRIFVWSATELVALARAADGTLTRVATANVAGVRRVIGTTGRFGVVVVHDDRVSFRSIDTLQERFSLRALADGTCLWHVPHPTAAEPHPGFYWRRGGARDLPNGLFAVVDPEGNLIESDVAAPFIERAFQRRHVRLALTDYAAFLRVMGAAEHALPAASSVPLLSATCAQNVE